MPKQDLDNDPREPLNAIGEISQGPTLKWWNTSNNGFWERNNQFFPSKMLSNSKYLYRYVTFQDPVGCVCVCGCACVCSSQ